MKTYTQEDVNEIINEKLKTDLFERILKYRDDIYNIGFGEGYKKGFDEGKSKIDQPLL
jgi:flagellar biosynthesis/type III secretory pathway protein FliH